MSKTSARYFGQQPADSTDGAQCKLEPGQCQEMIKGADGQLRQCRRNVMVGAPYCSVHRKGDEVKSGPNGESKPLFIWKVVHADHVIRVGDVTRRESFKRVVKVFSPDKNTEEGTILRGIREDVLLFDSGAEKTEKEYYDKHGGDKNPMLYKDGDTYFRFVCPDISLAAYIVPTTRRSANVYFKKVDNKLNVYARRGHGEILAYDAKKRFEAGSGVTRFAFYSKSRKVPLHSGNTAAKEAATKSTPASNATGRKAPRPKKKSKREMIIEKQLKDFDAVKEAERSEKVQQILADAARERANPPDTVASRAGLRRRPGATNASARGTGGVVTSVGATRPSATSAAPPPAARPPARPTASSSSSRSIGKQLPGLAFNRDGSFAGLRASIRR